MKETIYTIPVTEAFESDCECPLCFLENKLENEYVELVLGASLMEPDSRKKTNDKGFCRKHFEMIYNKQENKLGLGLIIDTHMTEQNKKLSRIMGINPDYEEEDDVLNNEEVTKTMSLKTAAASFGSSFFKKKKSEDNKQDDPQATKTNSIDKLIKFIDEYEEKCYICDRLVYTMDRYIDVIYYLYFKEQDFKNKFDDCKGFCLPHLKNMLEYAKKLDGKKREYITGVIFQMQVNNMERVQKEINWFTKKFDYRYEDQPWKNSKDAIPRSIRKLTGPCRFK